MKKYDRKCKKKKKGDILMENLMAEGFEPGSEFGFLR